VIAWSRCRVRTKANGLLSFTARCVYRRNIPAGTKSTDSASIYGVKMSERFSRLFSLVDGGGYRGETSVRLENCNNNGDFASICPQWVHGARGVRRSCSRLVNTRPVYIIFLVPLKVLGYLLSLVRLFFFLILFANFPEQIWGSRNIAEKYQHFDT